MPGVVKIQNNAGGLYEPYVKWLPEETLHMDYNSGLMVLPAYFTNAMALDFMCDAVRNQRELTLNQAVNLYERYMEEQRRIGLMRAQIDIQQRTASYAQSAAISSAFTAVNTFFCW